MPSSRSFSSALVDRISERSDATALRMASYGQDAKPQEWQYRDLAAYSASVAKHLHELIRVGDRVLLLYPPGLDFCGAFIGTLVSGAIPVPVYPPNITRTGISASHIENVIQDCQPKLLLTVDPFYDQAELMLSSFGEVHSQLKIIASDKPREQVLNLADLERAPVNDVAFLQYTSGSTGTPKGVVVTHGNLLHNADQMWIRAGRPKSDEGKIVSWLPPYHDMGLIGMILETIYGGGEATLLSPLDFLHEPVRWLSEITRYRATHSAGPNFGYELCVKRVTEAEIDQLDLSSWAFASNGAERIQEKTLEAFAAKFARAGFNPAALFPCYGLAESTLIVTGPRIGGGGIKTAVLASDPVGTAHVSCGEPVDDTELVIVDAESRIQLPEGSVGDIWIDGPSVAAGYWNAGDIRPIRDGYLSDGRGPFLRTGDMGFFRDSQLFVTGRTKDVLVMRGRNFHPEDLENAAVQSHPEIRGGGVAAFSVELDGDEKLVLVIESKCDEGARADVARAARGAVARSYGIAPYDVVIVGAREIPKTSSGKIRRFLCREMYLERKWSGSNIEQTSSCDLQGPERNGLTAIVGSILLQAVQSSEMRPDSDFFADLGGDSISAADAVQALRAEFDINVPLRVLYDHPTAESLADYLTSLNGDARSLDATAERSVLIAEDSSYKPVVKAEKTTVSRVLSRGGIFVTGCTGNVGPFLVSELLEQTDAKLYCLIRAKSPVEGKRRILRDLVRCGRSHPSFESRIVPVVGDLGEHRFGLSEDGFVELANAIDSIFHNGARVNFLHQYDRLRAPNVLGTKQIVDLSTIAGLKHLFYSSTVGVFDSDVVSERMDETMEPADVEMLPKGYTQTKWVGERIVKNAMESGVPAQTFRIGIAGGDSVTGKCADDSLIDRIIVSILQMRSGPAIDLEVQVAPVDFVARALVYLALNKPAGTDPYHIVNPHGITPAAVYEFFKNEGYQLEQVPYKEVWRPTLLQSNAKNSLYPLFAFFDAVIETPEWPVYDSMRMQTDLSGSGIVCPPLDAVLLGKYLKYYEARWSLR